MNNPWTMITQLSPELCMIVGACVVFLAGVSRRGSTSWLPAPLTLAVLLVSMFLTARYGGVAGASQPPGIAFTPLVLYVRWITLLVGALIVLVNWHVPVRQERGDFFGMVLFSLSGVMLTASANDLVVLFLAIELVSVPTYVLVALSRTDARASQGSVKYFFLGALAAAVMVYGFSFLYGQAGTTVLHSSSGPSIAGWFASSGVFDRLTIVGLLLAFAGLLFKVAAVPFHAYAPDVYEGAASPVTGLLGFLPKLAGFIAMVKLLGVYDWELPVALMWLLWVVAALTMTAGNVLALLQRNVKRILAYSSIAHTGYMLIGLLVGPKLGAGPLHDGVAALLFYIVIYGVMNLGAFGVLASLKVRGEAAESLDDLAGIGRTAPLSALAMAICTFSLMGFPPTAGLLGKVYVFSSAFSVESTHAFRGELIVLTVIAVINSAIGAAYYLRIAGTCYLREGHAKVEPEGGLMLRVALAVCSIAMLVLFVLPNPLARNAQMAMQDAPASSAVAAIAPTATDWDNPG